MDNVGDVRLLENVLEALDSQLLAPLRLAAGFEASTWKPSLNVELESLESIPLNVVHGVATFTSMVEELSHHKLVTTKVIETRDC